MTGATGSAAVTGPIGTEQFLAASPAPPLDGPAAIAERLVLLVHRGVDWTVWGGARRVTYWDALSDRVRAGTYAGPSLTHWWQATAGRITSSPKTTADRAEVATLLAAADQRAVLVALRETAEVLVLRVRVAVATHRGEIPGTTGQHPLTTTEDERPQP